MDQMTWRDRLDLMLENDCTGVGLDMGETLGIIAEFDCLNEQLQDKTDELARVERERDELSEELDGSVELREAADRQITRLEAELTRIRSLSVEGLGEIVEKMQRGMPGEVTPEEIDSLLDLARAQADRLERGKAWCQKVCACTTDCYDAVPIDDRPPERCPGYGDGCPWTESGGEG